MSLFSMRKVWQVPVLLGTLVLVPVLSGCGGGGGGGGSSTSPPAGTPMSLTAAPVDGLTAKLSEDNSTISANGKVKYTETLTNTSASNISVVPKVINGANVPDVQLIIKNSAGVVVFGGSQPAADSSTLSHPNQGPPSLPGSIVLTPGQSLSQTVSVGVFTAKGVYSATATFTLHTSASTTIDSSIVGPLKVTVS